MTIEKPLRHQTLAEWLDRFDALIARLNVRTQQNYSATGDYLIESFGADRQLWQVTPAMADDWRAWLQRRGLADYTVASHVLRARTIFGRACKRAELTGNPFAYVDATAPPPVRPPLTLTEPDIDRLIQACPNAPWRALVGLCALAGLRRGEALRLDWEAVRLSEGRLEVRPERITTKQRPRTVKIEPALGSLLGGLGYLDGLVAPIEDRGLHRAMGRIVRTAGLEPFEGPFQSLRRWRATTWRRLYPESVVDSWMGHTLAVARVHYVTVEESYYRPAPPTCQP